MREIARQMILLGFGIDSVEQRYFVPVEKLAALLELLEAVLATTEVPVWNLQSLLGKAQSMSLAVPPVALYLKSSFTLLKQADQTGWSW